MRCSRVLLAFTLRSLLLLVAVVALDCAVLQRFLDMPVYEGASEFQRVVPPGVGLLPLLDFIVVGSLVLATRFARSVRRVGPSAIRPFWSPSAVFFCLHFVLLGVLLLYCLPDARRLWLWTPDAIYGASSNWPGLEQARYYAVTGWTAVAGAPEESIAWVVFDCVLLGVVVSGPVLVASWVGAGLARRGAATLPRHRFLAMLALTEFGFLCAGLAILLKPRPFVDEVAIPFEVTVVDEGSGRPVQSAFVSLTEVFPNPFDDLFEDQARIPVRAFTDADGRARLTERFIAKGERSAFKTHATALPWGRWLEVSAEGYRTRRVALPEVLGAHIDPDRPAARAVTMARGSDGEDAFRDCAGLYTEDGDGFGGRMFIIERDGRFKRSAWGCMGMFAQEYGYLRRCGEELELVPIPRTGWDVDPNTTKRYRTVAWGRRVYLSAASDDALEALCREALTPDRLRSMGDAGDYYLREPDGDVPRSGLPSLPPRVWLKFLVDELDPTNARGSLRLAVRLLVAQKHRGG